VLSCLTAIVWAPVLVAWLISSSGLALFVSLVLALLVMALPFVAIAKLNSAPPGSHIPWDEHPRSGGAVGLGFLDILGIGYWRGVPVLPVPPLIDHRPRWHPPRRNDPCPCGSGEKFKACHGRPGWRHILWTVMGHGMVWVHSRRRRTRR
jgi:hypothetical protein